MKLLQLDEDSGIPRQVNTQYVHTQSVSSSLWTIVHSLGHFPALLITSNEYGVVIGDATWVDSTTVTVQFSAAITGTAHCH
jgi:hypothetical protein